MRFRTKAASVDAMQFTDLDSYMAIIDWWRATDPGSTLSTEEMFQFRTPIMLIQTAAGTGAANPGDWIVREASGIHSVCPLDRFGELYEYADQI